MKELIMACYEVLGAYFEYDQFLSTIVDYNNKPSHIYVLLIELFNLFNFSMRLINWISTKQLLRIVFICTKISTRIRLLKVIITNILIIVTVPDSYRKSILTLQVHLILVYSSWKW